MRLNGSRSLPQFTVENRVPEPGWLHLTGAREPGYIPERGQGGKTYRIVGGLGISSLAIQRFRIPNRTCRSLMYQVRLAAGLLRPDVQFKRSVSPIRYFLLNPSIDGPWEGNSAEQETSGTHGARKYAKHVRNAALTFDHSYMCILYIYIICIYTRTYIIYWDWI